MVEQTNYLTGNIPHFKSCLWGTLWSAECLKKDSDTKTAGRRILHTSRIEAPGVSLRFRRESAHIDQSKRDKKMSLLFSATHTASQCWRKNSLCFPNLWFKAVLSRLSYRVKLFIKSLWLWLRYTLRHWLTKSSLQTNDSYWWLLLIIF